MSSSHQDKMLAVNLAANHWYIKIWKCHLHHSDVSTIHVWLTILSGGGGHGVGVTGERVDKPTTAVWECCSTFVSVKPLDIFRETNNSFQPCCNRKLIFWQKVRTSPSLSMRQQRYFIQWPRGAKRVRKVRKHNSKTGKTIASWKALLQIPNSIYQKSQKLSQPQRAGLLSVKSNWANQCQ